MKSNIIPSIFLSLILLLSSCQEKCPPRKVYFDEKGNKILVRHFDNKCNHQGVDSIWAENGCLRKIRTYRNNKLHGKTRIFDSSKCDSFFFYSCEYKFGKKHGDCFSIRNQFDTTFYYIYENGEIDKEIIAESTREFVNRKK